MAPTCGVALSGACSRPAMAGDPVVGSALPAVVTCRQLADGVGAIELVSDRKNLKRRLHEERRQTPIWRHTERALVDKRDKIELFERRGQALPVRCLAAHQDRPEAWWLHRIGERR